MGASGQLHAVVVFTTVQVLVPFVQLAGWDHDECGEEPILLAPPVIEVPTYQLVPSHHTNYSISARTVHYNVSYDGEYLVIFHNSET